MESDERPSKARKLNHDKRALLAQLPDLYDGTSQATAECEKDITKPSPTTDPKAEPRERNDGKQPETTNRSKILQNSSSDIDQSPESPQALSKNQQKKLRKKQDWEAGKDYRKAKRKEKTKEKRERKRNQRDQETQQRLAKGEPLETQKQKHQRPIQLPITFLIDCGFDDMMVDKERISLASQITRSYSDNSRAPYQAHLVVSSWGGYLKERFDTVLGGQHQNWKGMTFTEDDFVTAAERVQTRMLGPQGRRRNGKMEGVFRKYDAEDKTKGIPKKRTSEESSEKIDIDASGVLGEPTAPSAIEPSAEINNNDTTNSKTTNSNSNNETKLDTTTISLDSATIPPPEIIYLTSDSPYTLTTLTPYSTYIIGGIVDKNRHKGLCYKTACDRGIKTAKLPIGEFMEMQSRFVLATNHVVEIMVRWLEVGDWGRAFMMVIPKRKGGRLKADDGGHGGVDGSEEGSWGAGGNGNGDGDGDGDETVQDDVDVVEDVENVDEADGVEGG